MRMERFNLFPYNPDPIHIGITRIVGRLRATAENPNRRTDPLPFAYCKSFSKSAKGISLFGSEKHLLSPCDEWARSEIISSTAITHKSLQFYNFAAQNIKRLLRVIDALYAKKTGK